MAGEKSCRTTSIRPGATSRPTRGPRSPREPPFSGCLLEKRSSTGMIEDVFIYWNVGVFIGGESITKTGLLRSMRFKGGEEHLETRGWLLSISPSQTGKQTRQNAVPKKRPGMASRGTRNILPRWQTFRHVPAFFTCWEDADNICVEREGQTPEQLVEQLTTWSRFHLIFFPPLLSFSRL